MRERYNRDEGYYRRGFGRDEDSGDDYDRGSRDEGRSRSYDDREYGMRGSTEGRDWERDRSTRQRDDYPGRTAESSTGYGDYGERRGERATEQWQGRGRDWDRSGEGRHWDRDEWRPDWQSRGGGSGPRSGQESGWTGRYGEDRFGGGAYYGAGFHTGEPVGLAGMRRGRDHGYGGGTYGERSHGDFSERGFGASGTGSNQEFGGFGQGGRSHFGRGPKGYTRSDDRIREDVCDRLSRDHWVDASEVTVTVNGGEVTLEGMVEDRRMKHRAEDLVDDIAGVQDVHNRLRVRRSLLGRVADKLTGRDANQETRDPNRVPPAGATASSGASTAGLSNMSGRNGTGT